MLRQTLNGLGLALSFSLLFNVNGALAQSANPNSPQGNWFYEGLQQIQESAKKAEEQKAKQEEEARQLNPPLDPTTGNPVKTEPKVEPVKTDDGKTDAEKSDDAKKAEEKKSDEEKGDKKSDAEGKSDDTKAEVEKKEGDATVITDKAEAEKAESEKKAEADKKDGEKKADAEKDSKKDGDKKADAEKDGNKKVSDGESAKKDGDKKADGDKGSDEKVVEEKKPEMPKQAYSPLNEAIFAIQTGHADDGVKILSTLLTKEPKNIQAHYLLGISYVSLRKYEEAATQYKQVLQLAPNSPVGKLAAVGLAKIAK